MTESAYSAPLRIATRESRLALWQASHVAELLRARHPAADVALLGMTTRGDQILDRPLAEIGGKGLFTKELEVALFDGRAELAVHSLKDVPMELPEGFELAAVMTRADARDAFVSTRYASLDELPSDAVVGTSSLRRAAQLQARHPGFRIQPLRGNLDTRLGKLDAGQYDAIVLAAGLISTAPSTRRPYRAIAPMPPVAARAASYSASRAASIVPASSARRALVCSISWSRRANSASRVAVSSRPEARISCSWAARRSTSAWAASNASMAAICASSRIL